MTTHLSVKQASQYLQVTIGTLRAWIKAGKVRASRSGRRLRIHPDDLETLLQPIARK